jgi:hypothetical protein
MTIQRTVVIIAALLAQQGSLAFAKGSLLDQWRQGLTGAYMTAYKGSVLGNSSSLTELWLCKSGRFVRRTDAGFYLPGQASGASKGRITGRYDFKKVGGQVHLVYRTDRGQTGSFPLVLQRNGRVNIGGAAFAVQQGGAGC